MDTMCSWQLACQNRGACRLTDDARRDGVGKACALTGQLIEMWRLDLASLDPKTVGAVLVGGNEQDIGSGHEDVFLAK
jgi:hypothetical protein